MCKLYSYGGDNIPTFNCKIKDYGNGQKQVIVYDNLIRNNTPNVDGFEPEFESSFVVYYAEQYASKGDSHKVRLAVDLLRKKEDPEVKQKRREVERMKNNKRNKNLIYDKARSNEWEWFITLTYSPNVIDRTSYDDSYKMLSKWLNNIRSRYAPDIKYLFVPELHEDGVSWHWHGLLANCGNLSFIPAINQKETSILYQTQVYHKGKKVYNLEQWKFGHSTATKVQSTKKISKYICKYINKQTHSLLAGRNRHISSRNLNLPQTEYFKLELDEIKTLVDSLHPVFEQTKKIENDLYPNVMHIYELDDEVVS